MKEIFQVRIMAKLMAIFVSGWINIGLAESSRPNLLVIMTDDQGRWSIGEYDRRIKTPNIDYIAEHGVRFDQAISPTPVCSAARASFFTGRTASQHGVHDFLSDADSSTDQWLDGETLLSEILSDQGYRVGLFGKWHATTKSWNPVRGFDRWLTYDEREADWVNQYLHSGTVYFSSDGQAIHYTGVQARYLSEEAVRFIDSSGDDPFAAFVNFVEPHFPFEGLPDRLVEQYRAIATDIVAAGDTSSFNSSTNALTAQPNAPGVDTHAETIAQYLAAVTLVDEQVGRLLDALTGRGLLRNTVVIFTSDHGHLTGQYGLYGKGNATVPQNLYQQSINIPLIISGPIEHVTPGQVRQEFVNLYDIFPTVLELIGAGEAQADYDGPGISLIPLLKGRRMIRFRDFQFAEMGNARMAHDGRWKLVRYYRKNSSLEPKEVWFDLSHPLGERRPAPAPSESQQEQLRTALNDFFSTYETDEHSGRRIWDLPRHNGMEIWRKKTF